MDLQKSIGIIGGGPAALFMLKRLIENGETNNEITIFERNKKPGAGMPYSHEGAGPEHITNVSGNEIPDIRTGLKDWIESAPDQVFQHYHINPENFHDYKGVL
jgi:uncharacterized NAD(P)/FAD-binding protein YdhS